MKLRDVLEMKTIRMPNYASLLDDLRASKSTKKQMKIIRDFVKNNKVSNEVANELTDMASVVKEDDEMKPERVVFGIKNLLKDKGLLVTK